MFAVQKIFDVKRARLVRLFYQSAILQCQDSRAWSFRNTYSPEQIIDPSKIRFSYSGIYHIDVYHKKKAPHAKATGSFILICFIAGVLCKIYTRGMFDSEVMPDLEKKFQDELLDSTEGLRKYFLKTKAASNKQIKEDDNKNGGSELVEEEKKKVRIGFRDSKIIAYEDRIRAYSTPDKIFRYFGSIQDTTGEIYMTPKDFVRSITPGAKQPDGLGLDSFRRMDLRREKVKNDVEKDSVFYMFGDNALLNFSDYVFLLSVISTPPRQFEIAFRMFDLNGDGELDVQEFEVVRSIIHSGSAIGKRHRDNTVTGNTINNDINSSLSHYFFGKDGQRKLTIQEFLKFQADLQNEIMRLEFNRYDPVDNKIREVDFADALLLYAGFSENKKRKFLRRVKQKFDLEESPGITFEDYVDFSNILRSISDIDTALTFYHLAGASIDRQTLKNVSKAVANVDLSDHLIDLVFTLFDENNDNHLSNREFISVMKQRLLRGLDKPMDTGFFRLLSAMTHCSKKVVFGFD